jgi:hypothetical protein
MDHIEKDASNNSSIVACVFVMMGTLFTEPLPNNDKGIHRHMRHREGGLTEELLEAVFSLRPDSKLYSKDNFLLKTVVSSQLHHTKIQRLKDLIAEPIAQQWPSLLRFSGCTIFRCHFICPIYVYMVL